MYKTGYWELKKFPIWIHPYVVIAFANSQELLFNAQSITTKN
jgi:hypothetical protein